MQPKFNKFTIYFVIQTTYFILSSKQLKFFMRHKKFANQTKNVAVEPNKKGG